MVFKERKVRNAAVRKSVIFAEAPRIWYGDKVYMLMPIERQTYHSLFCPVCGNIRKVTITGRDGHEYTYPCPERTSEGKERKNTLTLFRYEVRELIVQSITISGPDSLASYPRYRRAEEDGTEAKEKDCPRVSMGEGIFKRGSGNKGIHTVGIYDHPRVFEPDEEWFSTSLLTKDSNTGMISSYYRSRKSAVAALDTQVAYDKKQLEDYNSLCGTDHKYPWDE